MSIDSDSVTPGSANQCVDWLRRFAENRLADLCGHWWMSSSARDWARSKAVPGSALSAGGPALWRRAGAGPMVTATKTAMACRTAATSAWVRRRAYRSRPTVTHHLHRHRWLTAPPVVKEENHRDPRCALRVQPSHADLVPTKMS